MKTNSLGIIETCGLIGAIEASDAALKAAQVTLQRKERPGGALVTVLLRGDTAAVQAAVEAGVAAAAKVCPRVTGHLIPRPDDGVEPMLEQLGGGPQIRKKSKSGGKGKGKGGKGKGGKRS